MTRSANVMNEVQNGGDASIPVFELEEWRSAFGVVAGITGAAGGFDMGLASSESIRQVMARWEDFLEYHSAGFCGAAVSRQSHGAEVHVHRIGSEGVTVESGFDGHVTNVPGVLLGVTVADCIPVYLLHPRTGVVAMLHAGWRGIVAGILERGIEATCELAASRATELVMHCGVGICGTCYEVGPEVLQQVTNASASESGTLDLRPVLASRALEMGLEQVTVSSWCSAHSDGRFHSHRASQGSAGRMLAYIGRPVT
ncbi:MAG: polyphenol oxidase family protein [Gemmatimonadota bacterium]|nr:MAG: polyphenol oxidase family protein [Gemmatimonadota bacterium]